MAIKVDKWIVAFSLFLLAAVVLIVTLFLWGPYQGKIRSVYNSVTREVRLAQMRKNEDETLERVKAALVEGAAIDEVRKKLEAEGFKQSNGCSLRSFSQKEQPKKMLCFSREFPGRDIHTFSILIDDDNRVKLFETSAMRFF